VSQVGFSGAGRSGAAIYDAQIAATAKHHGLKLLSRDRRAAATYDAIGVDYELV
jgi:predicted nucleic acid-binding protein